MKGIKLGMTSVLVSGASVAFSFLAVVSAHAEVTVGELKAMYGPQLQVLGEVQRIDPSKGVIVVAGQRVAISKETIFSVNRVAVSGAEALRTIQDGDILAIIGALDAPAASVDRRNESYVPGATTIFVKGKVTSVEQSLGRARIGDLNVDYTPALSNRDFGVVEVGQIVEVIGTQPSPQGVLLANSITGTGSSSITGTGQSSITGTGSSSITGTGQSSITGTGSSSITGTGQSSITGTGSSSITGTGSSSITGTGSSSITGTGKSSITGTGSSSITGTGQSSITGTGSSSITGTGKSSITGTGSSSITGTGQSSITGTVVLFDHRYRSIIDYRYGQIFDHWHRSIVDHRYWQIFDHRYG